MTTRTYHFEEKQQQRERPIGSAAFGRCGGRGGVGDGELQCCCFCSGADQTATRHALRFYIEAGARQANSYSGSQSAAGGAPEAGASAPRPRPRFRTAHSRAFNFQLSVCANLAACDRKIYKTRLLQNNCLELNSSKNNVVVDQDEEKNWISLQSWSENSINCASTATTRLEVTHSEIKVSLAANC